MRRIAPVPAAFFIALLSVLSLVAGCGGGREQAIFERTCSRCHSLDLPRSMSFDRAKWEETVRRMSEHAAASLGPIPAAEQAAVVEYLMGRQRPGRE